MPQIPRTRMEAMEKAYKARGRSVPLRYKVKSEAVKRKLAVSDERGGMRHHFSPSRAQVATEKGEKEAKKYGRKMYNSHVTFDK